jgi:hypothetical protein
MKKPTRWNIKPAHIFWGLVVFWTLWGYTEISERFAQAERDQFIEDAKPFVYQGERFTKDDGEQLKQRIDELEQRYDGEVQQ